MKKHGSRCQFSLRLALLSTALVAVLLGWSSTRLRESEQTKLTRVYGEQGATWSYRRGVLEIRRWHQDINREELALMVQLAEVNELDQMVLICDDPHNEACYYGSKGPMLTPDAVEYLSRLGLKRLTVNCPNQTDEELLRLRELTTLREVDLGSTSITPLGRTAIRAALPECRLLP